MVSALAVVGAILFPVLLGVAFLLGRYLRSRGDDDVELSVVTRQHLDLYQGGQLSEAAVESVKRRFHDMLERGEVERIESSLRPGTQFVVKVRALAEIGTEEACQILERQLQRRLGSNQMDQAWYWIDLANSLRCLNREESLPLLLECVRTKDDFPLVHYYSAEVVCFLGFGGLLRQMDTPEGDAALRVLYRALEGLRMGVSAQIIVEARLGEMIETLWDERPIVPHPLLVRIFVEIRREIRRRRLLESAFADEPFEQEAFDLQVSRWEALESALEDYLQEAGPALLLRLPKAGSDEQRDIINALLDLRLEAGKELIQVLHQTGFKHGELAAFLLRWSKEPNVGTFLRAWTNQSVSLARRGMKRLKAWPPRRGSVPPTFPYRAVLIALRGHYSPETEQFLLSAAHDWDPTFRSAALSSLGWSMPFERAEVLLHLQDSRFDPSPDVRHAARAALARLGERQALQWFRQALCSENRQRVLEAVQAVKEEGLTLLWPELDKVSDLDDPELASFTREVLEQMQEDFEYRIGQ